MDVHDFFSTVFGAASGYVLVWTLPDRRSRFFTTNDLVAAARYAIERTPSHEVYVGCGLRSRDFGPAERGKAHDVAGIPGLWVDFDVLKQNAKKEYIRSREALSMVLDALPIRPTLRLWTGGGSQPWWLFREPWMFADDDERARAAAIVQGWQGYLRARALEQGGTIDGTHDLARVLRPCDTINHKYNVRVVLEEATDLRCNPLEFAEFVAETPVEAPRAVGAVTPRIMPCSEVPAAKLTALLANDAKFARTWRHERLDLKDHSLSAHDQALASLAARAGWTDAEIVALLVAHRRAHGGAEKLTRLDYVERTLTLARNWTDASGTRIEVRPGGLRVRRL